MGDARAGRGKEGFDKKKHDEGYERAFYTCNNKECPLRYSCFRWLRTPTFEKNSKRYEPDGGKCDMFVEDRADD